MLISQISRPSNCAFRSVAIFVALKERQPAKCSKIKFSFSSPTIFFCLIPAGVWWVQFLLLPSNPLAVHLKGRERQMSHFWNRHSDFVESGELGLLLHFGSCRWCLFPRPDVCLCAAPPSPSVGKFLRRYNCQKYWEGSIHLDPNFRMNNWMWEHWVHLCSIK